MTSAQRRHCMQLLDRAKTGDETACNELVREIVQHFHYMIRRYRATDPAYDGDDMLSDFRMAVWQAIPKVDGRGDPLYHLAWRGQQAVRSILAVVKARRQGTKYEQREIGQPVSLGTLPEGWDPADKRQDSDPAYGLLVAAGHQDTTQHLFYLVSRAPLSPRQRDVVTWMLDDPDVNGDGANLRLATTLGISPQAASRQRRLVMEILSGLDHGPSQAWTCEACGRELRSKGALTQHQNGQSGHRPCPAVAV